MGVQASRLLMASIHPLNVKQTHKSNKQREDLLKVLGFVKPLSTESADSKGFCTTKPLRGKIFVNQTKLFMSDQDC